MAKYDQLKLSFVSYKGFNFSQKRCPVSYNKQTVKTIKDYSDVISV